VVHNIIKIECFLCFDQSEVNGSNLGDTNLSMQTSSGGTALQVQVPKAASSTVQESMCTWVSKLPAYSFCQHIVPSNTSASCCCCWCHCHHCVWSVYCRRIGGSVWARGRSRAGGLISLSLSLMWYRLA